jgi:hypothetical protein
MLPPKRDIFRLSDPAKRRLPFHLLAECPMVHSRSAQAVSFDHARVKRVHTNLARTQLLAKRDRNHIDCNFACTAGDACGAGKGFLPPSAEVSQF